MGQQVAQLQERYMVMMMSYYLSNVHVYSTTYHSICNY